MERVLEIIHPNPLLMAGIEVILFSEKSSSVTTTSLAALPHPFHDHHLFVVLQHPVTTYHNFPIISKLSLSYTKSLSFLAELLRIICSASHTAFSHQNIQKTLSPKHQEI